MKQKNGAFVDEVYNTTTTKINLAKVSEKFNMMGLPKLPDSSASDDDSLVGKVCFRNPRILQQRKYSDFYTIQIDQKPMKQFTLLNSILAVIISGKPGRERRISE